MLTDREDPTVLVIHDPEALWKGTDQAALDRALRDFAQNAPWENGAWVIFTSPYRELTKMLMRDTSGLPMP